jgi:hypothetical protein
MINQNQPNQDIDRLKETLSGLSMTQIRFVIARLETKTDKEAAEVIQISPATVKSWNSDGSKTKIDQAVDLMRVDGMITALEIRRRNLAKAMAVKVSGLDSDNEKIKQDAATEIIEWELGKAPNVVKGDQDDGSILVEIIKRNES